MKLRDLRKQAKLTAKQVADKVGVTTQAIYKYEQGVRGVDIMLAFKLAVIYDVTFEEIGQAVVNSRFVLKDNPQ